MDGEELIKQAERIKEHSLNKPREALAEAKEFLKTYAGEKSAFYEQLSRTRHGDYNDNITDNITSA